MTISYDSLTISHSDTYTAERAWIFRVMLGEFLDIPYQLLPDGGSKVLFSYQGRSLRLNDSFFQTPASHWLKPQSLPQTPLKIWDGGNLALHSKIVEKHLPVIYGEPGCDISANEIHLHIDIFGSAFFMLTRYEEYVKADRDGHERFPAKASLAFQEGFLERPIINEYLEILWACMKLLWPELERKSRQYRILLSHDVDHPLAVEGRSWQHVLKDSAKDVVYGKDFQLAWQRLYAKSQTGISQYDADPFNTFDFIMSTSENYDLKSAFYFITDHSAERLDGFYSIQSDWIQMLIKHISSRGHEIGLHPSYNSYRDLQQIQKEFLRLKKLTEHLQVKQSCWGGRQHFLRWQADTWQHWQDVGLHYDSTLTYAEHCGFRCGVCYEYSTFNLKTHQALELIERPLIVMEVSLWGKKYLNLSYEAVIETIKRLGATCRMFRGDFTLLWHNDHLVRPIEKQLYHDTLEALTLA